MRAIIYILTAFLVYSCRNDTARINEAQFVFHNAYVYPVEGLPIENGAIVIADGKIKAIGTSSDILKQWTHNADTLIDCKQAFLMPGFIEGHGHFHNLGNHLIDVNLLNTKSWNEIVDSVKARVAQAKPGEWIVGRGWHQEKWTDAVSPSFKGYPYHDALSSISPDNPVALKHASGHSLIANTKAMEVAGITAETPDPDGGLILRDHQGVTTGVFEENALELIDDVYDAYIAGLNIAERDKRWKVAMSKVQHHCLQHGITTFHDAGSTFEEVAMYREMARKDSLDLRLYVMVYERYDSLKSELKGFPIIGEGHDFFTCRTIKAYSDGALGSYGAWMLQPYHDRPGHTGQVTTTQAEIDAIAELCMEYGMQMAVHAIGDKANRNALDTYESVMRTHPDKKDLRWRIEHAQHIDPSDIIRFKELGVIASMQAVHCTSDAPFVVKRLGEERAWSGAYPWRALLDEGVVIANGTDAPVEKVDPIQNFYASVTRKRPDSGEAFFPEQVMTREEAIYSMTMANAFAAFEEQKKGSLKPGKYADIVMLSQNLVNCTDEEILKTQVKMTMVGGEVKFASEE